MASLFKTLGNEKRRMILKLLRNRQMHITGVAEEIGVSVPVALKHVKKLEESGLVSRTKVGNMHLLCIPDGRMGLLDAIWSLIDEPLVLEAKKGERLSDVLSRMPQVAIKRASRGSYIESVDGKGGYYIYEIDGELSNRPIDACRVLADTEIEIKRLVPALGKKIRIKVK